MPGARHRAPGAEQRSVIAARHQLPGARTEDDSLLIPDT